MLLSLLVLQKISSSVVHFVKYRLVQCRLSTGFGGISTRSCNHAYILEIMHHSVITSVTSTELRSLQKRQSGKKNKGCHRVLV